uniref:UDP-3-O-acyl-N-acetylglucosamine deacetylase n=1 Tax=candidate division WOR-3 bacterium TaxID=2052148 RepID=A0A7C4U7X1_UNCW3
MRRKTIKNSIIFEGKGIHTGEYCKIILHPSEKDGIFFLKNDIEIPLSLEYVVDTDHGTTIGKDGISIRTIEHLTSCFFGLGIDNLLVEVDGSEIPILDGSSRIFCEKIMKTGFKEIKREKSIFKINGIFTFEEMGKFIGVRPSKRFSVTTIISYEHNSLFKDIFEFNDLSKYIEDVSKARTFGVLKWKEKLSKKGLIKGGDYNNLLIYDDSKNINKKRYKNEVARHKCLDFLGDLSLLSINVIGDFIIFRTGHSIHYKFFKLLKEREDLWSIT